MGSDCAVSCLNLYGAIRRIDDARKFEEKSISKRFYYSWAVMGDVGRNKIWKVGVQASSCTRLVYTNEVEISHDIGRQDGR
jgi:hypothetical protein